MGESKSVLETKAFIAHEFKLEADFSRILDGDRILAGDPVLMRKIFYLIYDRRDSPYLRQVLDFALNNKSNPNMLSLLAFFNISKNTPLNFHRAYLFAKMAAIKNNVYGIIALGMYYHANVSPKPIKKIIACFERAASLGNSIAQNIIGKHYLIGDLVSRDYKKSFEYFQLSAAQCDQGGQHNLAYSYTHGYGIDNDVDKALYYYQLAALQNYATAYASLRICYRDGRGCDVDKDLAVKFSEIFKNNMYSPSYIDNFHPKDYHLFDYCKSLAEKKDPDGYYRLGYCFEHGVETTIDEKKAFDNYFSAVELNHTEALLRLAKCYEFGKGTEINIVLAYNLYLRSGRHRNIIKMHNDPNKNAIISQYHLEQLEKIRILEEENIHLRYCPGEGALDAAISFKEKSKIAEKTNVEIISI